MSPRLILCVFGAIVLTDTSAQGELPAPRMDLHGDPLPAGAIARMGTVRWRHTADVRSIAFAPDGKLIASTCRKEGEGVWLWDAVTGREVQRIKVSGDVYVHAFTPDGKALLLDVDDRVLALHDVATGRQLRRFPAAKKRLRGVALSRDGKCLAYGGDEPILRLCDPVSGREFRRLYADDEGVMGVAFSPDGKTLATTGQDRTLRLWDVSSGKCLRTHGSNKSFAVAFAPDGRTLAWGDNEGVIRLMDVASGRILQTIKTTHGSTDFLTFAPDGKLLASGGGWALHLCDPTTGMEHPHTKRTTVRTFRAAFAPDGKTLALFSFNPTLRMWDVDKGREKPSPSGHENQVRRVAVAPDGRLLLSASGDRTIRQWEMRTGRQRHVWLDEYTFAFAPDGNTFAVADETGKGIVRIRETKTGRQQNMLQTGQEYIFQLAYSPDGKRLAMCGGEWVQVWEAGTNKPLQRLSYPPRKSISTFTRQLLADLCFVGRQPRYRMLMTEGDWATLWDVENGENRVVLDKQDWNTKSVLLSPDGKMSAVRAKTRNDTLLLWEIASDRERGRLRAKVDLNGLLALAPDGRIVAATHADNSIRLWSIVTGAEVQCIRHPITATAMTFAPDGKALITAHADTTILVWDASAAANRNDFASLPRLDLEKAWTALAGDADKAHRAIWQLTANPKRTVPFLAERLHAAMAPPRPQVERWIAELDSADFATRQRATAELKKYGEMIIEPLRSALRDKPSLEVRRRMELILDSARAWQRPLSDETLRSVRAVEVLEHIGTSEAQSVLKKLAAGAAGARLTEDATAALIRLRRAARK